jgi:ATP-dependent metalloprotease
MGHFGICGYSSDASDASDRATRSTRKTMYPSDEIVSIEKDAFSSNSNQPKSDGCSWSKSNPLPIYQTMSALGWIKGLLYLVSIGGILFICYNIDPTFGDPTQGKKFELVRPKHGISLADVKGNVEAKEELTDVVEFLKCPQEFIRLGLKVPKGVLLTGPPGTGKTMMARALAAESGVSFIATSGADFEEVYMGVGACRVRRLFEFAKTHAPCVVFIDEIDVVGAKRGGNEASHLRMSINQLLIELDGFDVNHGVVVIGATNLPEVLDPALIRPGRFDRNISLELPNVQTRKEMLDCNLKGKKLDDDVSTSVLSRASLGFSGADLASVVNWASLMSFKRKNDSISMAVLEEAMLNVSMGMEKKSLVLDEKTKRLCAYHESGHALVSLKTPGAMEIQRATLVPRGGALALVSYLEKENSTMSTKQELLAQMDTAMGGRAAEELIFGDLQVTQGAESDIKKATKIATTMISRYGMSKTIGPVYFPLNDESVGESMKASVHQESAKMVKESYDRAYCILRKNQTQLQLLAEALLKYESLNADEIRRVVDGDVLLDKRMPTIKTSSMA